MLSMLRGGRLCLTHTVSTSCAAGVGAGVFPPSPPLALPFLFFTAPYIAICVVVSCVVYSYTPRVVRAEHTLKLILPFAARERHRPVRKFSVVLVEEQ